MHFRPHLHHALAATALLLNVSPATALIVHEGQVVQAWPEDSVGPPTAEQATPRSFYTAPKGEVYGLTIVVDFSDTAPAFTVDQVKSWLLDPGYSEGGLNGSIRDYYLDQSNGMLDFRNDVVGFVRARQPKSYYEAGNGYSRASELVAEVIQAIDPMVDFSKYDNDGNGSTEAISIVYAGPSVEFAQGLWPHAGTTRETRDGVRVSRYQMTNMGSRLGLYVFAHEIGHMLFGWPDLYGFGNYCIMGNSSTSSNPVGINDLYRADQGWISVVDITETTNARFGAVPNAGGYRYVNPRDPGEWFFWYNQRNTGRWSSLRGNGLLVLHFDHSLRSNNPPNPLSLAVVQADGRRQLDQTQWPMPGSDAEDFYRAGGNTELSASTNPTSKWNDGSASGLRLYDISESGEVMTFAVGNGTPGPGIGGATSAGGRGGAPSGGASGMGTAGMPSSGTGGAMGGANAGGLAGMSTAGMNTGGATTAGSGAGGANTAGTNAAAGTPGANLGGAASASGGAAGTFGTGGTTLGGPSAGAPSGGSVAASGMGNVHAAAPVGGLGTADPGSPGDDAGCACRASDGGGAARYAGSLMFAAAIGVVLRRRRGHQA